MNQGWVMYHRKIKDNIFLMKDNNAYLVFSKLLVYVNSNGQWAGGKHQLAELLNVPAGTLYETLRRLQANHMITIAPNHKYTTYTICKWAQYQGKANQRNELFPTMTQPPANREPTVNQHSNNNEIKNKNNKSSQNIDLQLAAKEKAAKTRKAGYDTFKQVGEVLKTKKLQVVV